MRLLLVRHGETAWNAEHRVQGQVDIPLNAAGRAQAARIAARLASESFDAVYASPLLRAWETATAIAAHHDLTPQPDARLVEMGYGAWEGLSWDEIRSTRPPEEVAAWRANRDHVPEAAETQSALTARAAAVLADLTRDHEEQSVLLVSHGGILRTLICVAIDIDPARRWHLSMRNSSVSELIFEPRGAVLVRLNDTCHLDGL